jgi:hypothetical protein
VIRTDDGDDDCDTDRSFRGDVEIDGVGDDDDGVGDVIVDYDDDYEEHHKI